MKIWAIALFAVFWIGLAVLLTSPGKPSTKFLYIDTPQGAIPCVVVHGNFNGLSCDWKE